MFTIERILVKKESGLKGFHCTSQHLYFELSVYDQQALSMIYKTLPWGPEREITTLLFYRTTE